MWIWDDCVIVGPVMGMAAVHGVLRERCGKYGLRLHAGKLKANLPRVDSGAVSALSRLVQRGLPLPPVEVTGDYAVCKLMQEGFQMSVVGLERLLGAPLSEDAAVGVFSSGFGARWSWLWCWRRRCRS